MFVYGTQYLRGATPERDQWEKDMESMKKLGFNTIRAWLVWNALERREGEIDYQYISDFLCLAKKYGLDVGLLFHLHASPHWAIKKFSKYFYVTEDNLPFEPAVRPNTPSSGWPGLCYDNPEVRELEEKFISAVISETKKHSNVAFYEPMNEPHQWVDLTKKPVGIFCYCPASVKKFQQWLKDKYGSIDVLNNAWGYFYDSFDDVRPPRWTASYSDYIDFRQFETDNVADEIKFRTDIIRANDTKPVIAHAWGGGSVTCPQLAGMAFDDFKNAKIFDKWGYSAFPSKAKDCVMLGMGCNATRSAANGKEYWQSELTAGHTAPLFSGNGRVDKNTFDKFTLESIRHGASGLLFWQYRKERIGNEFGGYAMADFDGGPTPLTEEAAKLGKMLSGYGDILKSGRQAAAKVALVFSIRSYFADWAANNKKNNKYAIDSLSGYYKMFWEENIPVDIIHEELTKDIEKYKIIILPSAMAISPKFAEKLKAFIESGGTVLSEQLFGIFDDTFKLSYTVPGFGFDGVFGAKHDDLIKRSEVKILANETSMTLTGNHYIETYKNVSADVLYRYENESPAIIANSYGKGKAYLTGVNLGLSYSGGELVGDDFTGDGRTETSDAAKEFVLDICKGLGIGGNICTAKDVKVSVIETDTECLIILINSAADAKKGEIALTKEYGKVSTVFGNSDVSIDGSSVTFTLAANESAVLHLK